MANVNFDLNTYKTRFTGGARQYLFYVFLQFPATQFDPQLGGAKGPTTSYEDGWQKWLMPAAKSVLTTYGLGSASDKWPYLVKSTALPDISLEEIVIPYQHLDYKMAGITRYGDWSVTFYLDDEHHLLGRLRAWQRLAHGMADSSFDDTNTHYPIADYRQHQEVHLINYSGQVLTSCILKHCWPKTIGQVSLDYASGEIATVDVTFSVLSVEYNYKLDSGIADTLRRGYEKAVSLIRG